MWKKDICVSEIAAFRQCPAQYYKHVTGKRRQTTAKRTIGDAGHLLAAGESEKRARRLVERKLRNQPKEVRNEAMEKAVEFSRRAEQMTDFEVGDNDKEVQLSWCDEVGSGWTLFAKLDRLYTARRQGRDVLVIEDLKSAKRVTAHHMELMNLFGLIAGRAKKWRGRIQLVVSLPNAGSEGDKVERYYSNGREGLLIQDLRKTLAAIEKAWRADRFEEKPSRSCEHGCQFFSDCEAGQKFVADRKMQHEVATPPQPVLLGLPAMTGAQTS